ncbi:unnamed protein product [Lupinus luteus]|uniref:Uncharacterized protein n=1 Tax=Lupinus luteus TaxID=3873 RepID=A0AAV1XIR3_LUPLU
MEVRVLPKHWGKMKSRTQFCVLPQVGKKGEAKDAGLCIVKLGETWRPEDKTKDASLCTVETWEKGESKNAGLCNAQRGDMKIKPRMQFCVHRNLGKGKAKNTSLSAAKTWRPKDKLKDIGLFTAKTWEKGEANNASLCTAETWRPKDKPKDTGLFTSET